MSVTTTEKTVQRTTTISLEIRVPNDGDRDLVTDAEQRLTDTDGVARAIIDELHDIEPGLSATRVKATTTVETASVSDSALRDRLTDRVGVNPHTEGPP